MQAGDPRETDEDAAKWKSKALGFGLCSDAAKATESLAGAWDGSAAEQETRWGVHLSWPSRVALTSLEPVPPKKAQQRVPWPLGYSLVNPPIVEPEAAQPWASRKN